MKIYTNKGFLKLNLEMKCDEMRTVYLGIYHCMGGYEKAAIHTIILFYFSFIVLWKKGLKGKVNSEESSNMRKVSIRKTYR